VSSAGNWLSIEWQIEIGICNATASEMTREDLRDLRMAVKAQVADFGWNMVDLKSTRTEKMFVEELNSRLNKAIVDSVSVKHVAVWE